MVALKHLKRDPLEWGSSSSEAGRVLDLLHLPRRPFPLVSGEVPWISGHPQIAGTLVWRASIFAQPVSSDPPGIQALTGPLHALPTGQVFPAVRERMHAISC